jgi:hypothetical protein
MHTALVAKLLKDRSAWRLVTLIPEKTKEKRLPVRPASLVTA